MENQSVWKYKVLGRINCWLPISSFARNLRFITPVASTTAVVPATANYAMSVGAYDPSNNRVISTSSRGPNRIGDLCPDFVAPSNGSTSISAAIAAGIAALLLSGVLYRQIT